MQLDLLFSLISATRRVSVIEVYQLIQSHANNDNNQN